MERVSLVSVGWIQSRVEDLAFYSRPSHRIPWVRVQKNTNIRPKPSQETGRLEFLLQFNASFRLMVVIRTRRPVTLSQLKASLQLHDCEAIGRSRKDDASSENSVCLWFGIQALTLSEYRAETAFIL